MKSYRKELWFDVPTRRAFINITPQVAECVRESGVNEGLVLVNAMHITASVFITTTRCGWKNSHPTRRSPSTAATSAKTMPTPTSPPNIDDTPLRWISSCLYF